MSTQRRAEGMLLLVTVIWGGTFGTTKALLNGGLLPMGLLTWRFAIASVIFSLAFHRRLRGMLDRRTLLHGALLGSLLYLGFALQTTGLGTTSSSRSGFITVLYVIFTPLLQVLVTRRVPGRPVMLGVLLVLIGLWGLTAPGGTIAGLLAPWSEGGFGSGDALTLGSAIVFAAYIILLDRFATESGSIVSLTATQLITTALLSAVHCMFAEPWSAPGPAFEWGELLFLAIFATVLSTYWQTRYQHRTTPSRAAVIFTMESVFSAVFSALFLGEWLGTAGIIGACLIVAGLLVTELGGRS